MMDYYIDRMAAVVDNMAASMGRRPRAHIITHGCQMNARDSETIAGMLELMGYDKAVDDSTADVVIFNTCCIRENAENKLYGNLGNFKQRAQSGEVKVILCGCMMQQDIVLDKIRGGFKYVSLVFGTHNIHRFPELLHSSYESGSMIIDIWQDAAEIVEDLPAAREFRHKVGVNIMYGCDNYCTFCIVPYVRGRERSRKPEDILNEVRAFAKDGVKEVMLLGQNVDSYGMGKGDDLGGVDFAQLLNMVAKVEGIERIRFMSSHPKDISDDVLYAMRDNDNICKHLHLPVQSGSSHVLKWMNRGYSRDSYMALVNRARDIIPGISLTTDIMVGFPKESEEDFQETLSLVRDVRFSGAFTFIYSKRIGTPAAVMEGQVDDNVVKERFARLLPVVNEIVHEISREKEGKILSVMADNINKYGILSGRSDDNSLVHFKGDEGMLGRLTKVKITEARTFYLNGEVDV